MRVLGQWATRATRGQWATRATRLWKRKKESRDV